jgi:hypothetical protein
MLKQVYRKFKPTDGVIGSAPTDGVNGSSPSLSLSLSLSLSVSLSSHWLHRVLSMKFFFSLFLFKTQTARVTF